MITRVRKLILEQPLPQYALAAAIGIHPSTLSNYGLGRAPITNTHLIKMCRYFQIPPEQILGYVDEPDIVNWEEDLQPAKGDGSGV